MAHRENMARPNIVALCCLKLNQGFKDQYFDLIQTCSFHALLYHPPPPHNKIKWV